MTKTMVYAIITVMIAISVFTAWYLYVSLNLQIIQEEFENGFGEWVADADVPLDPNNPGHLVEWNITRATSVARSSRYSVRLFIDGRQNDGTIWIERKITVQKSLRTRLTVSFEFHSEQESFNTIAVVCAYAGIQNPAAEEDFTVLGPANQVAGWKKYSFAVPLDTGLSEEFWVAVGISVRWETHMTYYLDDVEIGIR